LAISSFVFKDSYFFLVLHPHFTLHAIGASSRSAGRKYKDAAIWRQTVPLPQGYEELVVKDYQPEEFKDCDIVISGLYSSVAGDVGRFCPEYDQ